MSYNSNFQIIIQLHELQNIYMRRQGFASIRIQIVDESSLGLNYASPIRKMQPKIEDKKLTKKAWIEGNAWMSSIMPIQYLDQVYQLNEIVQFNLSVSVLPRAQNQNIYLRFTLLFDKIHNFDGRLIPDKHGIQTVIIKLKNIQQGIFHYGQSYFTNQYYSKFSFTCFAINSFYCLQNKLFHSKQKNYHDTRLQNQNNINTMKAFIEWYESTYSVQGKGIQYFYETYAKNLLYNSQLLEIRVNQTYKQKKQTIFILPKFIKQSNLIVPQKQFFHSYANFDSSKITVQEYQFQIQQIKERNQQIINSVANGLANQLFNIEKLRQQYNKYDRQIKTWRVMKQIDYGQQSYKQSQNAHDVVQNMRKHRKEIEKQSEYPFQFQYWKREIFMKYVIYLPTSFVGKQLYKVKNNLPYLYDETKMVIVICHGYLSSGAEMRMLKRGINSVLPFAKILVSRSNQTHTETCLEQMGQRLAVQIDQFIIEQKLKQSQVILSFIGHSMGGIIARASFKHIPHLHQRFGFYCSIGTPHLGYLNGGLTKAGLWVMRKVKKQCKSLDQLSMYEAQHPQLSFLYNLSSEGNLKCFKKIILMSSAEDKFVPWHSARICQYKKKKVNFYVQKDMIQNIIGKMPTHRIDINFGMHKSDIQTMIGRKAHLNLITHYQIFDIVNQVEPTLFDIRQI